MKNRPDASRLAAELHRRIRGEVRFDDGSRALYATDSSNYRQVPIGVVLPRDADDIVETIAVCRSFGAPILPRGGGTSLAGQGTNVGVIIDTSKYMRRIVELDAERRLARVEPGVVLDSLRSAAERHHLTFGPDPATHAQCTLGGMIGNNSCGVHSVMAGKTAENIEALEVLTYDGERLRVGPTSDDELERIIREGGRRGEIYARLRALRDEYASLIRSRFPQIPRRVSGYNLDQLLAENGFNVARALVGSEGTCVTILEATARLVSSPPARSLLLLGYPDIAAAADQVPEILAYKPIGLEGLDDKVVSHMRKRRMRLEDLDLFPEGAGWLLVEFGGETEACADTQARALMSDLERGALRPAMRLFDDRTLAKRIWETREAALAAISRAPGEPYAWAGWEDAAVAPPALGNYLREFRALLVNYGYSGGLYGHFGDGCIHVRIDFDLVTAAGIGKFRAFMFEAADLVLRHGGSLSGEHGDGLARSELLPRMFGEELVGAFREFKAIWDPDGKMNPGNIVDPKPLDANLRLGAGYNPGRPATHFRFAEDGGGFAGATLRCVGVGKCRRESGGTMCPSFMVTREEQYSTRGRARLLFEMLDGSVVRGGWQNEAVKEALDLCLACKGCKLDCPATVDMATYKAEFMSHYYEAHRRPRSAYAIGHIHRWARMATALPWLPLIANFFTQTPGFRDVAKLAAGFSPARQIPRFAPRTFRQMFAEAHASASAANVKGPRVILWPDTFYNYFHPPTALAAVEVLEAAGFRVELPRRDLCCGRPLYDYGLLDAAQRALRQVLEALGEEIAAGVPVVVLEPSCAAVFRDELVGLFPGDEAAERLSRQTYLLGEFLDEKAGDYRPPRLERRALVHGHCHQKAIMGMNDEEKLLRKLGLELELPDSGCCGMAGGFGFEVSHYDTSIEVGERVLLPAVRSAPKDTLIVADGFSCREQIAQATDRRALHLAEAIRMAMRQGPAGPPGDYPERNQA